MLPISLSLLAERELDNGLVILGLTVLYPELFLDRLLETEEFFAFDLLAESRFDLEFDLRIRLEGMEVILKLDLAWLLFNVFEFEGLLSKILD